MSAPFPFSGRIWTVLPSYRMPMMGAWLVSRPISPSSVLAMIISARPPQSSPSGSTSWTFIVTVLPRATSSRYLPGATSSRPLHILGLLFYVLDAADHEERLLGEVVVLALADGLERGDSLLERHEDARLPGELLGDEHRVGQEPLDSAGSLHRDLVFLGQFVDAEDRDDVLQLGVALEDS